MYRYLSLLLLSSSAHAATPIAATAYLSAIGGPLYQVDFRFDGVNPPTLEPARLLGNLSRGGGITYQSDGKLLIVGAGIVTQFDLASQVATVVGSNNNANSPVLDPDGERAWMGWFDTVLSEVPLNPLAAGIAHSIRGNDSTVTYVAFTPSNGVFYANGGTGLGNFGRINMSTFATTRIAANLPATGVHFDSFNQRLLLVGAGTAGQRDPANPSLEISSRNDATTGENYLSFTPTGRGHAIATRYGNEARLIFIDYSATGLIGDPSTLFFSLSIPGVSDLSGQAALDGGLLMRDGFE